MKKILQICFLLFFLVCVRLDAQVLINEVKVNPPGNDDPYEFIEIRGTPGATLNNIYVCVIEGDSSNPGVFDRVFRINNKTLGGSGLMLFASSLGYQGIPSDCVFQDTLAFGIPGGIIENGSNTFAVFFSPIPFIAGADYDSTNDGQLELPVGALLMDAVGWTNGNASAIVYGGAVLSQLSGTPDAAVRFYSNTTPFSSAAWYCGDLTGVGSTLQFDSLEVSSNFPEADAALTPGRHNQPGFSGVEKKFGRNFLKVFPNPASSQLSIDISTILYDSNTSIRIVQANGVTIKTTHVMDLQNTQGWIDVSDISDGFYFLEYSNNTNVFRSGFVKTSR